MGSGRSLPTSESLISLVLIWEICGRGAEAGSGVGQWFSIKEDFSLG